MRDVNKIVLRGVVSEASRTHTFDDGRKLVSLNIRTATLEPDDRGGERERQAWHRVAVGGNRNVETAERLAPGDSVYVEGQLRTRKYRNKEGDDVYATEVRADIVRAPETAEPNVNRSIVLGNLGQTPELRSFPNFEVMNLTVATSESWTRRDGENSEETEWHRVSLFGDAARRLEGQLEKGQRVLVTGFVQTRKYTDREGRERRATETQAHSVLGSGSSGRGGYGSTGRASAQRSGTDSGARAERKAPDAWEPSGVNTSDDVDEVPF